MFHFRLLESSQFRTGLVLTILTVLVLGANLARADIVFLPDQLALNLENLTGETVVDYTGGGTANIAGYSLDLVWDVDLATAEFARPDSGPFATAVTFFVVDLGPGHVRIDAALGGENPGIETGQLCKITFTAESAVQGTTALDLTIENLRDPLNQEVAGVTAVDGQLDVDTGGLAVTAVVITNDSLAHTDGFVKDTDALTITATVVDDDPGFGTENLTADLSALGGDLVASPSSYTAPNAVWTVPMAVCSPADGTLTVTVSAVDAEGNSAEGSATITADNTPPTALPGVTVLPGHQQIHLSWSNLSSTDAHPFGVEFRTAAWGDYPTYDTAEPAYPADSTSGLFAVQATEGNSTDWSVVERDIYYLAGFVFDMALNYGPGGDENTGRATNYWLGDVSGDPDVDGVVDVLHDITRLGETYGLPDTDPGYDPDCDVAPTDSGSPRGIPQPNDDQEIGFEDMMVFALNYSVVTPETKHRDGGTPVLAWRQVSDTVWVLDLVQNGDGLQGLNLRAGLPIGVSCTVQKGELLLNPSRPSFLRNVTDHGLDAGLALFGQGAGFADAGELIRVTLSQPLHGLQVMVDARDADNADLAVQMTGASPSFLPTLAVFEQNYPNPFNPRTTLAFSLPESRQVTLAVFGLDGSRVRTLLDTVKQAGSHEVVWDGNNDAGQPVAAGTYFARIKAGDFRQIRKMVLLK